MLGTAGWVLVLGLLPALEQEALSQQEGQSPEGLGSQVGCV